MAETLETETIDVTEVSKLTLTTLGEIPVGTAFLWHGEWGDGERVFVKLRSHGFSQTDTDSCHCGTPGGGWSGPIYAGIPVQVINLGELLAPIAFSLASSAQEWHKLDT